MISKSHILNYYIKVTMHIIYALVIIDIRCSRQFAIEKALPACHIRIAEKINVVIGALITAIRN